MGFFPLRGEIVLQQSCWLPQPYCSSAVEDVLPTGFLGRAAQLGLPYPLAVDRGVRVLVQSDITAITFPAAARPLGRFSGWEPALCKRSHRTFWGFGDSLRRIFIIIYSLGITLTEKLMPPPERKNQSITPRSRSVPHSYPSASRRTILSIFRRTDDPSIVQNSKGHRFLSFPTIHERKLAAAKY